MAEEIMEVERCLRLIQDLKQVTSEQSMTT